MNTAFERVVRALNVQLNPALAAKCVVLMLQNETTLTIAAGSSHNHQAWPGGYLDHVEEVMALALGLHEMLSLRRALPFTLEDALIVMFLHDLEKPWKISDGLRTKEDKRAFREEMIVRYNLDEHLTSAHRNALRYVEGEGDDYRGDRRVMNELAGFCHACDVISARVWHNEPRART